MKITLLSIASYLFITPAFAAPCAKNQLVTLRFAHMNQSAQLVPAGTKAQLTGFKNGYVDAVLFLAAPKAGSNPTQCELVQKNSVLVGGNPASFVECELQPI